MLERYVIVRDRVQNNHKTKKTIICFLKSSDFYNHAPISHYKLGSHATNWDCVTNITLVREVF